MQSLLVESAHRDFAELRWIDNVTLENFLQHLARALIHLRHPWMVIHIRVEEFSERLIRLP